MVKEVIEKCEIHAVVYYFRMNVVRVSNSVIFEMKTYHSIGLDWSKTVFALTFADSVSLLKSSIRRAPGFDMRVFFDERFEEWRMKLVEVLREKVGVQQNALSQIKFCPTNDDSDMVLPNGEKWWYPLWCAILEFSLTHTMLK